jgi:hypothetical protein
MAMSRPGRASLALGMVVGLDLKNMSYLPFTALFAVRSLEVTGQR